ncbi:unnamed protein product, partial [marine sediment metagenome]
MALNLRHKKWDKTGRHFEVLDETGQPTSQLAWEGKIGEQQTPDRSGGFVPFLVHGSTNEIEFGANDDRLELASDRQIIKRA